MEVKQIVTELYSLRAGLSLISQEKDKFDAEAQAAEEQKNKTIAQARAETDNVVLDATKRTSHTRQSIQNLKAMLAKADNDVTNCRRWYENDKERYENNEHVLMRSPYSTKPLKKCKRNMALKRTLGILFLLLHIATVIMLTFISSSDMNEWPYYSPFVNSSLRIFLFAIAFIICITEFCLAAKNRSLGGIWFGIPYIENTLSFFGLMIMNFNDNLYYYYEGIHMFEYYSRMEWSGLHIFVFILAMLSTLLCIIFTPIKTHEYRKDDMEKIKRHESELSKYSRELSQAQSKQSELKEAMEKSKRMYEIALSKYEETEMAFEESNDSIDLNSMEKNCEQVIRTAESKYKTICAQTNKQYNDIYTALKDTYGNICTGIWDTLVSTYGDLLDVRDWGILDLVIWQLETGRAETLKEALQLADRETQTDRIVQTMQSASAAIAQRIDDGFGSLQSQLSSSFYTLARGLANATSMISSQIGRSSDILAGRIDASAQATASLYESQMDNMIATNRNLEQLFSQASLQTALLEKSNSSSKDLIETVKQIRKAQNA